VTALPKLSTLEQEPGFRWTDDASSVLEDYRARLQVVIADNAFLCTTELAKSYLAKLEWCLAQPVGEQLHVFRDLMIEAGIEDVIREAEWHRNWLANEDNLADLVRATPALSARSEGASL